jgi:hypothetical protein
MVTALFSFHSKPKSLNAVSHMNIFTHRFLLNNNLLRVTVINIYLIILFLFIVNISNGQNPASLSPKKISIINIKGADALNGTQTGFIKNIGQYGDSVVHYRQMGKILFGYEGLGMPILFTSKGLIHLQRKLEGLSEKEREEKERKERKGKHAEEELEEQKAIDKVITMEWLNANPDVEIIAEDQSIAYHTYASVKNKAFTYKKIIYKELYAGIDVVYSFTQNNKAGFEYSLIVKPGTDLSKVKMKFGGDVKKIKTDANGNLIIQSAIDGIIETIPVSYYGETLGVKNTADVKSIYKIEKNVVGFYFPND